MPTILRIEGYRFFFYSNELNEPAHIHVDHSGRSAKVWLDEVALAKNIGYNARELRYILKLTADHQQTLLEAWNDYFGD